MYFINIFYFIVVNDIFYGDIGFFCYKFQCYKNDVFGKNVCDNINNR